MTRDEAQKLLQLYREFPGSKIFTLRPTSYPLFHLLESFAKNLPIELTEIYMMKRLDVADYYRNRIDFEELAKTSQHNIWKYVVRNPQLTNTTVGFVHEDLYARYVGRCNPLRTPTTSWTFIPWDTVVGETFRGRFNGLIGKHNKLYQIEIDLNTTDIIGTRRPDVPWHYLQQTIDWKPWTGKIDWQESQDNLEPTTRETLQQRFERVRGE